MRDKVFGIGHGRTGTTTLRACLKQLGYQVTTFDAELLAEVTRGDLERTLERTEHFDGFEDWPWPMVYKVLDDKYPEAKFVLTVRRNGQTWLRSAMKHSERRGPTKARALVYGYDMPHGHEDQYVAVYETHNREVREYFAGRPGKLLEVCWENGSGWEELCSFLGTDVPHEPFPHAHKSPSWDWTRWTSRLRRVIKGKW